MGSVGELGVVQVVCEVESGDEPRVGDVILPEGEGKDEGPPGNADLRHLPHPVARAAHVRVIRGVDFSVLGKCR